MTRIDFGRHRNRSGTGALPPNPKRWGHEHNGLDLRDDLGVDIHARLDHWEVFTLLPGVRVVGVGAMDVAAMFIEHLRDAGDRWSGLAIRLSAADHLVVYNDRHPLTRVRATLMEEFYHIRLGHPPGSVRVLAGRENAAGYGPAIEDEAYGSGAAALVPYQGLKARLDSGEGIVQIAEHYGVSTALVEFRARVTRLIRARTQNRTSIRRKSARSSAARVRRPE